MAWLLIVPANVPNVPAAVLCMLPTFWAAPVTGQADGKESAGEQAAL